MVSEFNARQPKMPGKEDDAPAPTERDWREAKKGWREIALPDERF